MLNVGGESSGRIRETVTKQIKDCSPATKGSKCEFQLKIPGKCRILCLWSYNIDNVTTVLFNISAYLKQTTSMKR